MRRGGMSPRVFLSADIMTRVGNDALLIPIQKSTIRYEADQDQLHLVVLNRSIFMYCGAYPNRMKAIRGRTCSRKPLLSVIGARNPSPLISCD